MTNRQPILSRMFHADGTPRDRAMWLVFAGMAASLLLAFFTVCVHQVQRAESRHAQERASIACTSNGTVPTALGCASQTAEAAAPMGSQLR